MERNRDSLIHLSEQECRDWLEIIYEELESRILERWRRDAGMAGRKIVAKFKSKCAICSDWIEPGEEIYWDKQEADPKKRVTHVRCPDMEQAKAEPFKDPYVEVNEDLPF